MNPDHVDPLLGESDIRETQCSRSRSFDPPEFWLRFIEDFTQLATEAEKYREHWSASAVSVKEGQIKQEKAEALDEKSRAERDEKWQVELERLEIATRYQEARAQTMNAGAALLNAASQIQVPSLPQNERNKIYDILQKIISSGGSVACEVSHTTVQEPSKGGQVEKVVLGSSIPRISRKVPFSPTVSVITALPRESAAIRAALGPTSRYSVPGKGAGRQYWKAEVSSSQGGTHLVIIAQAAMGTNNAAVRAAQLLSHFDVESIIMCGIAGGIPHPTRPAEHVRLGDIVVSDVKGVVQYDFVKKTLDGLGNEIRKFAHLLTAQARYLLRLSNSWKRTELWESTRGRIR